MAPTTLAAAKTDLYNCLASDAVGTPKTVINTYVGKVYKGEPRSGDLIQANGLTTVTIWTAGLDGTSFSFILRIYKHTDVDVLGSQDTLDSATWAVESALSSEFARSGWTFQFDPSINLMLAETTIICGRQDF